MRKILLAILDGVGYRAEEKGNAFKLAKTPFLDSLLNEYPYSFLEASGKLVGLPEGQMGNSEVGHMNIGAGRIVYQSLELINNNIRSGEFFENQKIINFLETSNKKIHLIGIISDGGVHSHVDHFLAFLRLAKLNNIEQVYFHLITDGRDTDTHASYRFIKMLEDEIAKYNLGLICTICGRYAMDRDKKYDRTKRFYDLIVNGVGEKHENAKAVIDANYSRDITDEFIEPAIINDVRIDNNDSIFFINFRPDRMVQILETFTDNFNHFPVRDLKNLKIITMMPVTNLQFDFVYQLEDLKGTLGEYISNCGLKQLRIAETEKYPHVTYYFDGGKEKQLANCDRVLIPSPKVKTYDLKPEMSCPEITEILLHKLSAYDFVVLNYANGDMVGHTGNVEAAIKAMETVDVNLEKLYQKCLELDILLIITADHGNCEEMIREKKTTHSNNKVYFIVCDDKYQLEDGKLGDIAPTILEIMNLEKPSEMEKSSLIKKA